MLRHTAILFPEAKVLTNLGNNSLINEDMTSINLIVKLNIKQENDILPQHSYRNSRSPSRSEVEKAIVTLRSPSPASSKLFSNGTRSNLAYYKSSASPTNSDGFDYHRRSVSPPSKSTCRFSPSSYNPSKVTFFPRKMSVDPNIEYSVPNGVVPEIYAPEQQVLGTLYSIAQ